MHTYITNTHMYHKYTPVSQIQTCITSTDLYHSPGIGIARVGHECKGRIDSSPLVPSYHKLIGYDMT